MSGLGAFALLIFVFTGGGICWLVVNLVRVARSGPKRNRVTGLRAPRRDERNWSQTFMESNRR